LQEGVKFFAYVANEVVGMRALNSFKNFLQHHSNLASFLTLIILISEMLQFSKNIFYSGTEFVEENTENLRIFHFSK
jgi:hypothetical protein